ncbi:MAG TPA: carbon storage regulator CsrA [Candidatus Eremiobacteraceae bacterium]|jgi:carbon storage regulator
MLVLTRKLNQEIVIGDDIRITIVAVGGDQVKVGITAPRSIPVHRSEVLRERTANIVKLDALREPAGIR